MDPYEYYFWGQNYAIPIDFRKLSSKFSQELKNCIVSGMPIYYNYLSPLESRLSESVSKTDRDRTI